MNSLIKNNYLHVIGQIDLIDLHIQQMFDEYQQHYLNNELAQNFVKVNCKIRNKYYGNSNIGLCIGTAAQHTSMHKINEIDVMAANLRHCGLILASGNQLFQGCIVCPSYDANMNIVSAVGYRMRCTDKNHKPTIYWYKPAPKAFIDTGFSILKEKVNESTYH